VSVQPPSADVVMHAERAEVALHSVPRERIRVRREIITEDVTITVTVRREVLRLEREPLLPGDGASAGPSPTGSPARAQALSDVTGTDHTSVDLNTLEVVLSTERPVISLEVVPYERVQLGVRSVATATPVTVDVRHEVADVATSSP